MRHALIISEPGRYERAAREAYWAGFLPKMVRSIKRKRNGCYPKGNWSNVTEQSEIKLVNMLEAHKLALEYIVQANVPHAIFEDDIVLATSRAEVQGWLDTPSSTSGTTPPSCATILILCRLVRVVCILIMGADMHTGTRQMVLAQHLLFGSQPWHRAARKTTFTT